MLLLLLTGPPGAGKSTVATAVHDWLGDNGVANALLIAWVADPDGNPIQMVQSL